jgi:hypothetical protein
MATMPSGREVHSLKPYIPPTLDSSVLEGMRAPPDSVDDYGKDASSEEEEVVRDPVGAFPGTKPEYSGSGSYY